MSRGVDNCNPGNIRRSRVRYRGEVHPSRDPDFKQFESMEWGYRAMFVLLDTYHRRYGLDTVRGMIARYAPSVENDTARYVRTVCEMTGTGPVPISSLLRPCCLRGGVPRRCGPRCRPRTRSGLWS